MALRVRWHFRNCFFCFSVQSDNISPWIKCPPPDQRGSFLLRFDTGSKLQSGIASARWPALTCSQTQIFPWVSSNVVRCQIHKRLDLQSSDHMSLLLGLLLAGIKHCEGFRDPPVISQNPTEELHLTSGRIPGKTFLCSLIMSHDFPDINVELKCWPFGSSAKMSNPKNGIGMSTTRQHQTLFLAY